MTPKPVQSQNPGQVMILVFYSWTALSDASGSSVAMGITDDRARAMRAGEVTWNRFFGPVDPELRQAPGKMAP